MPSNSYFDQLNRIAESMEKVAEGVLHALDGQTFDFATDDGVRQAVAAVVTKMGGVVKNA